MAQTVTPAQITNLLGEDVLNESSSREGLDRDKLVHVVNSLPRDMIKDFVQRI
jgi:uncharacterized protein YidB (DUF937 family)